MNNKLSYLNLCLFVVLSFACSNTAFAGDRSKPGKKGKWVQLFNGKTLDGWHSYLQEKVNPQWTVENGVIALTGKGGKDLLTDQLFENFELELEWKISEGGNSGVMFHVHEDPKYKSADVTGPEMQVLDNERHPNAKQGPKRTAGSLFDMVAPADPGVYKPAGQWNKIRIVVSRKHVQYYMNGKKIVEYVIDSPEWVEMLEKSKYKGWEGYARYDKGAIALQDHGDKVWFKNIRIKTL